MRSKVLEKGDKMFEYSYSVKFGNIRFLVREGRDFDVIVGYVAPNGRMYEIRPWSIRKSVGEEVERCAASLAA